MLKNTRNDASLYSYTGSYPGGKKPGYVPPPLPQEDMFSPNPLKKKVYEVAQRNSSKHVKLMSSSCVMHSQSHLSL